MLTRERVFTISKLAFPMGVALSSALVMSLIDLAMVAPLGSHVTAAVGLAVFSQTLLLAFVSGIGPAVQGIVARRRGQGSTEAKCLPLNAGLLMAVVIGIPITIIGYAMAPTFFSWFSRDPAVIKTGVAFLRVLYLSTVAAGMSNAFKGHWTGMERPNVHMVIVLFANFMNFAGNYVLIHGRFGFPKLGATGAALSTTLSLYIALLVHFAVTWVYYRRDGFLSVKPAKLLLTRVFQLGMPATIQEFFKSAGYIALYWMIGQIGTAELAATNVQVRMTFMLAILSMALGNASATLVSKTVGEGDPEGAAAWGWDAGKLGVIVISLLALPMVIFPRFFLSLFLSDPHTIQIATLPWQLSMGVTGIASLIFIFAYTLVSVGDGNRVALVSLGTQWLFFLPLAWFVGPYLHRGLLEISILQIIYGAIATVLITRLWIQGRWKRIAI